ncbi:MAG: ABC transporter ATP-binding protein [Oligoflexia bacterium]|nr:ABC transporter ATP-binding protein [Oligoflexia bacterium]
MLEVKNLTKRFGSQEVLKGISLAISEGEILFVLGRSGTGKSVLLKNIVGLLKPESGQILLEGREISKLSEEEYFEVRKMCGMVFQHPALFDSLTVYENVAFGLRRHFPGMTPEEVKKRVTECLDLVHLEGVEDKLPPQISYGMQKRVSLARTIAVEPRYLLFDEPTTGLDPVTTNAINRLISELSRKLNTTSIVVSHDMHCALEIADRIAVLDQGQLIALGTPSELLKSQVPLVKDFLAEITEEDRSRWLS